MIRALAIASVVLVSTPAFGQEVATIRHVPIAEATTGDARLRFGVVRPELAGRIVVRARPADEPGARPGETEARRGASGWVARLPRSSVRPPGLVYWVVERMPDGTERPVFADAEHPHPVAVWDGAAEAREHASLAARSGLRSEAEMSAEYVDFGRRRLGAYEPADRDDRYLRAEGSYGYVLGRFLEEVRIGLGAMRGDSASPQPPIPRDDSGTVPTKVGLDYGRATFTWAPAASFHLRTGALLGISQAGFEGGGSGEVIVGEPSGTSFLVGFEQVSTLGWTSRMRLGWATVPHVPMGATVAVTTFPIGDDPGLRLLYDAGLDLGPLVVGVEAGYQGRTAVHGGPAAGMKLALRF